MSRAEGGPNVRRQRLLNRVLELEDRLERLIPDLRLDNLDGHVTLAYSQVVAVRRRLTGDVDER